MLNKKKKLLGEKTILGTSIKKPSAVIVKNGRKNGYQILLKIVMIVVVALVVVAVDVVDVVVVVTIVVI